MGIVFIMFAANEFAWFGAQFLKGSKDMIKYVIIVIFVEPVGEEIDAENVKEKLIKTMEDAKTTYQRYEEKCTTKNVYMSNF